METKFYRKYKVLKDTIYTNAGATIVWDLWRELYTSDLQVSTPSTKEETFTKFVVEKNVEWFEPIGKQELFYDKFPKDLNEHFYFGELRHNKMCKFCTIAQSVLDSEEYEKQVKAIFKKLYDLKIIELSNEQC